MATRRAIDFLEELRFQTQLIHHHVDGITDEESLLQLPFEANCHNWVVGNIIFRRHSALEMLGQGLFWPSVTPAVGEVVPIMESIAHVEEGQDPGPFNTDPPSSGRHYAADLEAGFYEEGALEQYGPYPAGYLVHNLEHGYVIFWYNCELLDEKACASLKDQIQDAMDEVDNFKVIAFPWTSINFPVVLTSWGKMQQFEKFDVDAAVAFVTSNRNRAPEPQAP